MAVPTTYVTLYRLGSNPQQIIAEEFTSRGKRTVRYASVEEEMEFFTRYPSGTIIQRAGLVHQPEPTQLPALGE